ncbi:MAG: hypothetical protein QOI29_3593 [Mycobacterium sp.]|jgi:hypothetical protein|nr:hypothetical protein [Mycobacterium sp.]
MGRFVTVDRFHAFTGAAVIRAQHRAESVDRATIRRVAALVCPDDLLANDAVLESWAYETESREWSATQSRAVQPICIASASLCPPAVSA